MIYPQEEPIGYQTVADLLRREIHSGRVKPGQRLPSELALAQTHGVATKTARAALRQLRDEGLAESVRGYGVVVQSLPEPEVVHVGPDVRIWARNPTPTERRTYGAPEGWPLIVVESPEGLQELYPAHRYRIVIRPESRP